MSDLDELPRFKPEYAWLHAAWCDALESGDYPQGTGWLRTKYGYCCLGVLKDVAAKNGVRLTRTTWEAARISPVDTERMFERSRIGFSLMPLMIRNDGDRDHRRQSFRQIARIVRKRMAPKEA